MLIGEFSLSPGNYHLLHLLLVCFLNPEAVLVGFRFDGDQTEPMFSFDFWLLPWFTDFNIFPDVLFS